MAIGLGCLEAVLEEVNRKDWFGSDSDHSAHYHLGDRSLDVAFHRTQSEAAVLLIRDFFF